MPQRGEVWGHLADPLKRYWAQSTIRKAYSLFVIWKVAEEQVGSLVTFFDSAFIPRPHISAAGPHALQSSFSMSPHPQGSYAALSPSKAL